MAAKCSRKNPSHSRHSAVGAVQHHLHQPAGMGAGVEGQRQLHDVLEIAGQHRLALAVRQPVGVQRDRRAAADGEQAERRPGRQQRPGRRRSPAGLAGEHVDDAAEQHRFGELRAGQQQIGAGENPAQPRLLAEQLKHARIEAKQGHADSSAHGVGEADRSFKARILIRDRRARYRGAPAFCSIDQAAAQRRQESYRRKYRPAEGRFRI